MAADGLDRRYQAGIARKIGLTPGTICLAFGLASYLAFRSFFDIHALLHSAGHVGGGTPPALAIARALRRQQSQTMHAVVATDVGGPAAYEESEHRLVVLMTEAHRKASSDRERELLDEVSHLGATLNVLIRSRLARQPRVFSTEDAALNQRLLAVAEEAEAKADALVDLSEPFIADFSGHASALPHRAVRWTLLILA